MIVEPVMMNAGIIPPADGYLAAIRDLLHAQGALLIYDEVKTGFTTGPGGVTAISGVVPRYGLSGKGFGRWHLGRSRSAAPRIDVGDRRWPLRAGRHLQRQPAVDGGHPRHPGRGADGRRLSADGRSRRTVARCFGRDDRRIRLRLAVVSVGAKGCVTFKSEPVREFRDFLQIDDRLGHLHWLMQHNGGVFLPPWGKVEQWLLSVQQTRPMSTASPRTSPGWPRRWRAERLLSGRPPMTGGAIRLHQLAKAFDGVPAVTGIDLDIPAGQFYSLLGASGAARTTTLRMIAGSRSPDSGRIELDGRDVVADPPHKRPVNTVFQTTPCSPS